MKRLLDLFEERVPDKETNRLMWRLCDENHRWVEGHDVHSKLRGRNLIAIEQGNKIKECQYCFEEVIAKTLFNFTDTGMPFDPDSPYWVIKNALSLAKALKIPSEKVVEIVA